MNVLQVLPYLAEARGGDVNACLNLSKQLVQRGHDVTILTTDFELQKRRVDSIAALGINVVPLHCSVNAQLLLVSPEITKWLKQNLEAFDVTHLHTFRAFHNYFVHRYAKKNEVPYILQAHGSLLSSFQKRLQKQVYDVLVGRTILKDAAKVIALTELEAAQCKAMGAKEDKIEIVPNGIDLTEYSDLPHKGVFRDRYAIENDVSLVLFLGRLHKIKGIDLLIRAFARLCEKKDKVKLVIAGPDAGALAQLKRLTDALEIHDLVLFTGPLYKQDKLEAYVDADLYVLPSVYETFPVAVLEAYACGTPAIVTTKCGIADVIKNFGYVVDLNVQEMCGAIMQLLGDDVTRNAYGERGERWVRQECDWGRVAHRIEQVYGDVAASY